MVTMLKPSNLSVAFGLARLQEEEVWRRNRSSRAWASTYLIPTALYLTQILWQNVPTCPFEGFLQIKCMNAEKKGYATTMMTSTT
jgi:hypothetical protein